MSEESPRCCEVSQLQNVLENEKWERVDVRQGLPPTSATSKIMKIHDFSLKIDQIL